MSNPFKTFEWQIKEDKNEIKELKKAYDIVQDHLVKSEHQIRYKNALIIELADAIDQYLNVDGSRKIYDASLLIAAAGNLDYQVKRAREEVKK